MDASEIAPAPETLTSRLFDWAWLLAFGCLASLWCVQAAWDLGATFDEPFYMQAGLEHWRSGSYRMLLRAGTMPLPVDVQTLPIYLWEKHKGMPFDAAGDLETFLPYARLGNLVFLWVLLIYARLIGRALAGPWAGRLAVAFLAIEPNFLGHACLATTDLSITAMTLCLAYHFARNRDATWPWRVGLPAVAFGFAILAKASALAYGTILMIAIDAFRLYFQGDDAASWRERVGRVWAQKWRVARELYVIGCLALIVVFFYCGTNWQAHDSFVAWAQKLPEGSTRNAMVWLSENLRVFPNAGEGMVRQVKHNIQGHLVFLLGVEHGRAFWYYFPVLLIIKVSLPLLLLAAGLIVTRPKSLANWACVCFLLLLIVSLGFRVQIGVRMILPMIALGIVGLAASLVQAMQTARFPAGRVALGFAACTAIIWTGANAALIWPHGLGFVNELWGPTRDGYLVVSDSNFDWGQGLNDLRRWQAQKGIDNLDVWYFGADPLLRTMNVREARFSDWKLASEDEFWTRMKGRYLAVGTTQLYGGYAPNAEVPRAILRGMQPVDRTHTFLIYDLRAEKRGHSSCSLNETGPEKR